MQFGALNYSILALYLLALSIATGIPLAYCLTYE